METVGFAVFFRDRLVAAVGGAAMLPLAAVAVRLVGDVAERADVVVVGAGVGGLAVAIRLAAAGRRVVVLERNDVTGGKLAAVHARRVPTFDVGPSLLTLPHVFDELFRVAGTSLAAEVELVRLDPQFHYRWPDGSSLVVPDEPDATAAAFDALRPVPGEQWRRFDERGRRIWEVSERTFLAGPMGGPSAAGAPDAVAGRSRGDRPAAHACTDLAAAHFDDPRLVQWAGRYATYSARRRIRAPATLACIPHVEARYGCWYVRGGLDALRGGARAVAAAAGATSAPESRSCGIAAPAGRVTGVELADGTSIEAPVVVANADAEHVYADLLPDGGAPRRVRRAGRSTSGFVDRCRRPRQRRAEHRAPQRVVLGRRSRRVRRARGRPHGRRRRRSTRASRP